MLIRFYYSLLIIVSFLIPTTVAAQDDGSYVGFSPGLSLGSAQSDGLFSVSEDFEKRLGASFEMYAEITSSDYYVRIGLQYANFGFKSSSPVKLNKHINGIADWNYDYLMVPVIAGGAYHFSDEFNLFYGAGLSFGYLVKNEFLIGGVSIPEGASQDTSGIKKWNIFGVVNIGMNIALSESMQLQCRVSRNYGLMNLYGEGFSTKNIGNTVFSIGIRKRIFDFY